MAGGGLRVLALARKRGRVDRAARNTGCTLLGLVAMMDLPRPEARAAVDTCVAAGHRARDDHPRSSTDRHASVAREVRAILGDRRVVSGRDLDEWTAQDYLEREGPADIAVYARVSPAHKLRVVEAWQATRPRGWP